MSIAANSHTFVDGCKKISFTNKRGDTILNTCRLTGKTLTTPKYPEVVSNLMSNDEYNRQLYNEDAVEWYRDNFRDLDLWDSVDALAIQQHRYMLLL